jgi:hypothetical protein
MKDQVDEYLRLQVKTGRLTVEEPFINVHESGHASLAASWSDPYVHAYLEEPEKAYTCIDTGGRVKRWHVCAGVSVSKKAGNRLRRLRSVRANRGQDSESVRKRAPIRMRKTVSHG